MTAWNDRMTATPMTDLHDDLLPFAAMAKAVREVRLHLDRIEHWLETAQVNQELHLPLAARVSPKANAQAARTHP